MFKKLLSFLFGEKTATEETIQDKEQSNIHDDIKKTVEEMKEKIAKTETAQEAPKAKKATTKAQKNPATKKAGGKKKEAAQAPKEKGKRGPKKAL